TIILSGLAVAWAQGVAVWEDYLDCVLLRKANGTVVTIEDLITGKYALDLLASTTNEQKLYGFLQLLIELNENPITSLAGVLYDFYPYLLLEQGDWVLSEGGNFEQVDADWFYSGNGIAPYWFAGGWPYIYGTGDCRSYCDIGADDTFDCIHIQLPPLTIEEGITPPVSEGELECSVVCLPTGIHCGITVKKEEIPDWTGACPQTRGVDSWITQTCWAVSPNY